MDEFFNWLKHNYRNPKGLTDDPTDLRLKSGKVTSSGQNEVYLILSEEERAKGFVRPLRRSYVHTYMPDGSKVPVVLTSNIKTLGCGALTQMGLELCETYARDPKFYGATYCVGCRTHLPVRQFHWDEDNEIVGT